MTYDDVHELLTINGFQLMRQSGSHYVYTDGVRNCIAAKSPSDWRAAQNKKSEVRALWRQAGREFIDPFKPHEKKEKKVEAFNQPRIVIPKSEEKPIKVLDKEAFEFLKKAKEDGWNQKRMLEAIHEMGYRNQHGGVLAQPILCKFMKKNGLGTYSIPPKYNQKKEVLQASLMSDLQEVMTSNISDSMKEKMIMMLVKEKI